MLIFRHSRTQANFCKRLFNNWLYQEGEYGYNNKAIENKLRSLPGGSVDLMTDDESGIGMLKINHLEKRNAFSGQMIYELRLALKRLSSWSKGKTVILYGTGHTFCAGADLATVREFSSSQDGMEMCMYMQNTLTALHQLPIVSVAFIEGKAVGGGAELATACDFRLMVEDAEIHFVHKDMGLIPGWGGLTRLIRLIGRENALKVLASGRKINSSSAHQCRLIDHVVTLSQKDIFHEIRIRSTTQCDGGHDSYTPDCTTHLAVDWLRNKFDLEHTDLSVLRAIKSAVAQCSEMADLHESLKFEKSVFQSLWAAEANLKAIAKSKHGKP